MFKISYFLEVLPVIARRVNVTFELTMISTLFALLVGVVVAIIAYYRVPVLYQASRVYVSIMRGTPIVRFCRSMKVRRRRHILSE